MVEIIQSSFRLQILSIIVILPVFVCLLFIFSFLLSLLLLFLLPQEVVTQIEPFMFLIQCFRQFYLIKELVCARQTFLFGKQALDRGWCCITGAIYIRNFRQSCCHEFSLDPLSHPIYLISLVIHDGKHLFICLRVYFSPTGRHKRPINPFLRITHQFRLVESLKTLWLIRLI